MTSLGPLSGLRLGVFGKGGAGKSTVTVLLAQALRERGHPVLVVDADSTNVGLASALGIVSEPEPLLKYFGGAVFGGGRVTCPVDDPSPLSDATIALADLPPAYVARNPDGIWLVAAGKLGTLGPGAGCDGPMAKVVRDLRVTDLGPDAVVLVDHKAGMEDSARGALTAVDWALAVVDPTTAALQMAIHLGRLIAEMQTGIPPATRHLESPRLVNLAVRLFREAPIEDVLVVLNRVPDAPTEAYLRAALAQHGVGVVGALREASSLQAQWLHGERLHVSLLAEDAASVVGSLEVWCAKQVPARRSTSQGVRSPIPV